MASKKAVSKGTKSRENNNDNDTKGGSTPRTESPTAKPSAAANGSSKKRKAQDTAGKEPSKASRKSNRGVPSEAVDPVKLINYLLSSDSLALCRPKDESADLEIRGKDTRAYSTSTFTPFEELLCAQILNRPISHTLGLRSIRTIFNDPHNLNTPRAIRTAGIVGCRQALEQARTQHRQKTAEELVFVADAVVDHLGEGEDDTCLERLREECSYDAEKEKEALKKYVKGMGKTGVDIFARRIQGTWKEWYPFADQRTLETMKHLGLAGSAQELKGIVDDCWKKIGLDSVDGEDDEEKKRKVFVLLLDRAVGCGLEGNVDEVKNAIM
ncbi:MAG: hypothetical protein Q9163_005872 [Psora crenata]